MNPAKATGTWKDEILKTFLKQGAWACLSLLILGFFAMELHWFVRNTGASVTEYVQQSSNNIRELNKTVSVLSAGVQTNKMLLENCTDILSGVQVNHEEQIRQSGQLLTIMNAANDMMKPVPSKHDIEIQLLTEIRDKIEKRPQLEEKN